LDPLFDLPVDHLKPGAYAVVLHANGARFRAPFVKQ
jgi:hypothetical protein